jgi:polar amino acid transport system ATP-binding protein
LGDDCFLLEIDDLHKSFGDLAVLKGISLRVRPGEVIILIGPSGSGKSTLLRCINRLEEPTRGRIRVDGTEITARGVDLNHVRKNIGMVFQAFNLYPHLTALGNVTLALRKVLRMGRQDADARGRRMLEHVGLADKVGTYPNELSGGQQQRVAIARALALEPKLMLFDEPTSALDPELVGSVLRVMRDLRDEGMTMVVVTHEMSFARDAGDRVLFMDGGEVVEEGPPVTMFRQPTHQRTREFLQRVLHV